MIRTLYTVNRSMNILQERQENTSANFANINTPGYKFQDMVQSTLENNTMINYTDGPKNDRRQELGNWVFGNQIDDVYKVFDQGILSETGSESDFAIVGNGFFTVQMPNGQMAYTRNGNFRINEDGIYETMDGHLVQGVYLDDGYMTPLITDFADYSTLESIGDTLFTGAGGFQIQGEIRQGFLERSNVDVVSQVVKMIEISRQFESNQRVLHAADETLSKAVNEVGRV